MHRPNVDGSIWGPRKHPCIQPTRPEVCRNQGDLVGQAVREEAGRRLKCVVVQQIYASMQDASPFDTKIAARR